MYKHKKMVISTIITLIFMANPPSKCASEKPLPPDHNFRSDKALLPGHDVNMVDKYGRTALYYAIESKMPFKILDLIQAGADINHTDIRGNTPLHRAIESYSYTMAQILIFAGANTRIRNNQGETPRDIALNNKGLRGNVMSHALDKILTEMSSSDFDKETELQKLYLLSDIDVARSDYDTVRNLMIQFPDKQILELLPRTKKQPSIVQESVRNQESNREREPIFRAKRSRNNGTAQRPNPGQSDQNIIITSILNGANINAIIDGDGNTYLHSICKREDTETAQFLIIRGADINKQNNDGETPLHTAIKQENNLNLIELLLQANANPNILDNAGFSVRDMALIYDLGAGNNVLTSLINQMTTEPDSAEAIDARAF